MATDLVAVRAKPTCSDDKYVFGTCRALESTYNAPIPLESMRAYCRINAMDKTDLVPSDFPVSPSPDTFPPTCDDLRTYPCAEGSVEAGSVIRDEDGNLYAVREAQVQKMTQANEHLLTFSIA